MNRNTLPKKKAMEINHIVNRIILVVGKRELGSRAPGTFPRIHSISMYNGF